MPSIPGFIGPTYENRSALADCQKCLNMYPEIIESGTGKSKVIYHSRPGLSLLGTVGSGPIRGMSIGATYMYVVSGSTLYKVTINYSGGVPSSLTPSSLGSVGTDSNNSPVYFAVGRPDIMFISNSTPYCIDDTLGSLISITGLSSGKRIVFLNGFFIAIGVDGDKFYISDIANLYSGDTWNALDYNTADYMIDNLSAALVTHNELWMIGDLTTEIWWHDGSADFPFKRVQEATMPYGIRAPDSLCEIDGKPIWLATFPQPGSGNLGENILVRGNGYNIERISNHAFEKAIAHYTTSTAIGWGYLSEGHQFYNIYFPADNKSWAWDAASGQMFETGYGADPASYNAFLGRCHTKIARNLIGSRSDGSIYIMDHDYNTDAGTARCCLRRAPHLANENKKVRYDSFEADIEKGLADITAYLKWSDDGGKTYNTAQSRTVLTGDYNTPFRWDRLGACKDRVFELYTTSNAHIAITDAYFNGTLGRH